MFSLFSRPVQPNAPINQAVVPNQGLAQPLIAPAPVVIRIGDPVVPPQRQLPSSCPFKPSDIVASVGGAMIAKVPIMLGSPAGYTIIACLGVITLWTKCFNRDCNGNSAVEDAFSNFNAATMAAVVSSDIAVAYFAPSFKIANTFFKGVASGTIAGLVTASATHLTGKCVEFFRNREPFVPREIIIARNRRPPFF